MFKLGVSRAEHPSPSRHRELRVGRRRALRAALIGAASLAWGADVASAADRTWTNTAGGTFQVGSNWSAGAVPTSVDNAFFFLTGPTGPAYASTFAADATNLNLHVSTPLALTLNETVAPRQYTLRGFVDIHR